MQRVTLSGVEFLRRFLQHVLPKGYVKVRYYGIWSPSCRRLLHCAQTLLQAPPPALEKPDSTKSPAPAPERCPLCRVALRNDILDRFVPIWEGRPKASHLVRYAFGTHQDVANKLRRVHALQ